MAVSVPLVVIFGVLVFVAYRYMALRAWHAVVALIFGFVSHCRLRAATGQGPHPVARLQLLSCAPDY